MRTKLEWENSRQKCKYCFRRKVSIAYDTWVSYHDERRVKIFKCAACGSVWQDALRTVGGIHEEKYCMGR